MKKQDLQSAAKISAVTIAKLGRNENVTTGILAKICTALNCNVGDIMDIVDSESQNIGKRQPLRGAKPYTAQLIRHLYL